MKKYVYLDNAATTSLHPKVLEKMLPFLKDDFGNPSSIHSFGSRVRVAIENARETIASLINADASEIYFTSGGTEANNFVINGITKTNYKETGRKKIVTNKAEHHAVLDTIENLIDDGFYAEFLPVNKETKVDVELLKSKIDDNVSLISIMHVNNETGSLNNISELVKSIDNKNIYFHTDAVQSFGKIKIDVKSLGVDSITASAHKINGPKGVGFAFVKSGTPISPLLFGGSQERNRRGGTENVAGIIGLAEAAKLKYELINESFEYVKKLKDRMIEGIFNLDKENIFINACEDSLPYILSITLNSEKYNNDSESLIMFLDLNGVAASSGSACTSGTIKASHVMKATGYSEKDAVGTIRFSFSIENKVEDIDYTLEVLSKLLKKFQK
ncbi:MAG: cysteine desulfurase [Melioribacteraceae bacterium]|nr:cysteine desulfurase [Melioribacteraceae bacterium]